MLGIFLCKKVCDFFLIKYIKCHHTCSSMVDLVDEIKSILTDKSAFKSVRIDLKFFFVILDKAKQTYEFDILWV